MESSNVVIQSLGGSAPLQKLRNRLSHELSSLQSSSRYLSGAVKSLRFATADVFGGDVPVLHNLHLHRSGRRSSSTAICAHCKLAASQVDEARKICLFVGREISTDLPLKLRTHKNIAKAALLIISDVQRKVQRLETQTTEQLAIITAADAEIKIFSFRASHGGPQKSKGTKRERNVASSPKIPDVKRALVLLKALT